MFNFKSKYVWTASDLVYSPFTLKNILLRVRFFIIAILNYEIVSSFVNTENNEYLKQELKEQPDKLGILVWPYIHKDWSLEERCTAIQSHYREISKMPVLYITIDESRELLDLSHVHDGLKVVLDRGIWFRREGELVLNLFVNHDRIYSLAFSFGRKNNKKILYIGGIQGVATDNIMDTYKEITKASYGMRPRDFLLNILKIICAELGVDEILAISNENRHHNHKYFKSKKSDHALINYDIVWEEQGGEKESDGFHHIKPSLNLKPLENIVSKKRSMYRKRYALLDEITIGISNTLSLPR